MRRYMVRNMMSLELRAARRSRWMKAIVLAWLVLGAALAWSATPPHLAAWSGWERTALAFLPSLLLFLPLAALLTAIHTTTGEAGAWEFLLGQPAQPREIVCGKLLAAWIVSTGGLLFGAGAGALIATMRGAGGEPLALLVIVGAGILLSGAFVTIGGWIAASGSRLSSLGTGIGVWLAMVFLYDFFLMAIASALSGSGAVMALLVLLVLNPVDSARVGVLTAFGLHEGLGPTGLALAEAGTWGAVAPWVLLALWAAFALSVGMRRWQGREGFGGL